MELVRLYGVGGLAGAVNPANLKTHLGVFLMCPPRPWSFLPFARCPISFTGPPRPVMPGPHCSDTVWNLPYLASNC